MELKELTSAFAAKMGIDGLTVEDGARRKWASTG